VIADHCAEVPNLAPDLVVIHKYQPASRSHRLVGKLLAAVDHPRLVVAEDRLSGFRTDLVGLRWADDFEVLADLVSLKK